MNKVIEQIHREFMTAGDSLLKEASEVLSQPVSLEKGERLERLGFVNASEARTAKAIREKLTVTSETASLVQYYQMNYPNNKFILESQVEEICKKYNLICGPVASYKGFVPKNKLVEIEQFSLKPSDAAPDKIWCELKKENWLFGGSSFLSVNHLLYYRIPKRIEDMHMDQWEANAYLRKKYNTNIRYLVSSIVNYTQPRKGLFICAPKKDMDISGLSKAGSLWASVIKEEIKDPVVLHPCKGGFLIVTAWGDEASDEIVVNHKMN